MARITAAQPPAAVPGINPRSGQQVNPRQALTFTGVTMALSAPAGWSVAATSATSFAALPPGASATSRWSVTAPSAGSAAGSGSVTATASFVLDGSHVSQGTAVPVSLVTSLADAFNNTGISDNSDVSSANLDGVGNSFSAQALAAAGLTPGASFTHDGVTFTWPDVSPGRPDNVLADGQTILISGSGTKLAFVGASSPSDEGGTGTVSYTDGTTSTYTVMLDNYFDPPDTAGNETIIEMPYINDSNPATNGGQAQRNHPGWIFYTAVPIISGKTVEAVTLPTGGGVQGSRIVGMHVFALGTG
jgi:beta-galactosidase